MEKFEIRQKLYYRFTSNVCSVIQVVDALSSEKTSYYTHQLRLWHRKKIDLLGMPVSSFSEAQLAFK